MINQVVYPLQPSPGGNNRGKIVAVILVLGVLCWQVYNAHKAVKQAREADEAAAKDNSKTSNASDGNANP